MFFETEQFDFGNEYTPPISFTPNQDGVYSISGNVSFTPGVAGIYSFELNILVNSAPVAAEIRSTTGRDAVSVSTIYGLNAGDNVRVEFVASVDGTISPYFEATHFAAARFPFVSPIP
ncbi:ABC transporter permease [Cytobacillus firmus]|uniref:ABC transporter permease n=1 Tax=Cytobacillus firmus TaxID=1399 RepID=UPI0024955C22|nr:ABC transporter permease [Cytobacillus firmus]